MYETTLPLPADRPASLREVAGVSVVDLTTPERFVVRTIRKSLASNRGSNGASNCASIGASNDVPATRVSAEDQATSPLEVAAPALQRFVAEAAADPDGVVAGSSWQASHLSPLETHALHAIACLQSGLLGEAWKTLARVCSRRQAGRALVALDDVATVLQRNGGRLARWHIEDGVPASAARH